MACVVPPSMTQYARMAKAGHPAIVLEQMMSLKLQVPTQEPCIQEAVRCLVEGQEVPADVLLQYQLLLETKYDRMRKRGMSEKAVEGSKRLDAYTDRLATVRKRREQGETIEDEVKPEPPAHYFPSECRLCEDYTVGYAQDERAGSGGARASQWKLEAEKLRAEAFARAKATGGAPPAGKASGQNAEDVAAGDEGAADSAPLGGAPAGGEGSADSGEEHLPSVLPEPPLLHSICSSCGERSPCSAACSGAVSVGVHVTEKMFSALGVVGLERCGELIKALDFTEEEDALHEYNLRATVNLGLSLFRTSMRRIIVHPDLAHDIWSIVELVLPPQLPDGRRLCGVRSKMNFYRYRGEQSFLTHYDGGHRFTATGETSEYTFVIYLNDGFEGGTTRFCEVGSFAAEGAAPPGVRDVCPVAGRLLLFHQRDMKHTGTPVRGGETKYIIQGMVMYGPVKYNALGTPMGVTPQLFTSEACRQHHAK
mmetsp:Transcript_12114/g.34140  ORF Transcript_12114/g.34140 Transcript_12114/m.34140 type:complete len:480 (+) Transcript_12114:88-1527(+)